MVVPWGILGDTVVGSVWVHVAFVVGPWWVHGGSMVGSWRVHCGSIVGPCAASVLDP